MLINIAIVEDEKVSSELIEGYIKKFQDESEDSFNITCFSDGMDIATDYKPVYDIIFMDIQMKHLDGMATASFIRELDKNVILIFITNMAQYAIKGYSVDALHFLLKPVHYFAFSQQLRRSVEALKKRRASYILLPTENGVVRMDVSQIIYFDNFRHRLTAYTNDKTYTFPGTINDMEEKLSGKSFFRCNNGYLVNLAYVTAVNGYILTANGNELLISRPRKKAFMDALTCYVGGMGS